eukprot:1142206-Pelagomonas_calceolata.AAC.2
MDAKRSWFGDRIEKCLARHNEDMSASNAWQGKVKTLTRDKFRAQALQSRIDKVWRAVGPYNLQGHLTASGEEIE